MDQQPTCVHLDELGEVVSNFWRNQEHSIQDLLHIAKKLHFFQKHNYGKYKTFNQACSVFQYARIRSCGMNSYPVVKEGSMLAKETIPPL